MKHFGLFLVSAIAATGASGCMTARVRPSIEVAGNWAEDPAKDRAVRAEMERKKDELTKPFAGDGVEIFVGKLPAGIKIDTGVLSVEKDAPYEIVGKAAISLVDGSQFGFPDYEDGWRKGVCYWQAPLTWVTLGIWAIVPVNYPCSIAGWRPKEEVLNVTKNLVRELGGQMFVGDYVGETRDEAMGIIGFIVRKREVAPAGAPAASGAEKTLLEL